MVIVSGKVCPFGRLTKTFPIYIEDIPMGLEFGRVNFSINGAGGNNPRASTDNETMTPDLDGVKDFFALEESGLKFVFDLNITSAFLLMQVFVEDMVKTGGNIINISSMNVYRPLTKIPAHNAAKAGFRALRNGLWCIRTL